MSITAEMVVNLLLGLARKAAKEGDLNRAVRYLDDVIDVYEMEGA